LLDWTNPGHVGSLTEWKNKVAIPLRVGQSHDAKNKQLSLARVVPYKMILMVENCSTTQDKSPPKISSTKVRHVVTLLIQNENFDSGSITYENG
jgi:hypothetical protein